MRSSCGRARDRDGGRQLTHAACRVGNTGSFKTTLVDGGEHVVDDPSKFVSGRVDTDTEQAAAGRDRPHGGLGNANFAARALHVERVAHDDAFETEFVAQQTLQDCRARGRRMCGVDLGEQNVRGHNGLSSGLEGRMERWQVAFGEQLTRGGDHWQGEVRILCGVAVTGEVLGARDRAGSDEAAHPGRDVARCELGRRAETARADHRVYRVAVHIGIGCEHEVEPGGEHLLGDSAADLFGVAQVIDAAHDCCARVGEPSR